MKRKILLMSMIMAVFVFAGFRLNHVSECWLRLEQSGICCGADYLHRIAEKQPWKVRDHLGASVSFAARLEGVYEKLELINYGETEKVMSFVLPEGKRFIVDCSGVKDLWKYKSGELLLVKGSITAINKDCVYILNLYGAPGFPNAISIEGIK